jgi:hypothetical protein
MATRCATSVTESKTTSLTGETRSHKRDSEAEVLRRLKNPTWRERWAFRRALLEHTELRGYRLRDAVREGIEMLRTDPSLAEEIVGAAKYGNEILYPAEQPVQSA